MTAHRPPPLADLYEADETAWLDAMAQLAARGDGAGLDYPHLAEYLSDMAKRDKREVESRLAILLAHLLKWQYQPDKRSRSWQATTAAQRQALRRLLDSRSLRNHAGDVMDAVYADGVEQAAIDTGLSATTFPPACPYTLDEVLVGTTFDEPSGGESRDD